MFAFLRQPFWRGVYLGLVCALAAWLISRSNLCLGLEDWMLDACFSWRGSRSTSAKVVLIGLDSDSLKDLNKPTAHRSPELAEVVRYAKDQGASAIGIDLMVPEDMSDHPDIEKAGAPGNARPMGQAVREAGNVVLPEWYFKDGQEQSLQRERPLRQWQVKSLNPKSREQTDFGFVNLSEDGDQFVRRQLLLDCADDQAVYQFALALYARSQKAEIQWDEHCTPMVDGKPILLEPDRTLRINFVGPPGKVPVVPFREVRADARAGRSRPEMNGAVVLIGVTARSMQDYHPTPFANHYARWWSASSPQLMSGPEVHAHILATLHDRAFIQTPFWLAPLPLLLLFGIGLSISFARLSLSWGFLLAIGHHFAWKLLALGAFTFFYWRIHLVAMLLLGFLTYGAAFALRWRTLRRMFGLVKSEAVARALEADPARLDPGGEERTVTVLFADIRGFTDFSKKHTPGEVVTLLNAYFNAVVPLIEAEGGTIDKYMGDGIMVLFGAPASCPDHPLRAVRAAVAMVRRVHELKETWTKLGIPTLRIGVGVQTGTAVVGAIGSRRRLDYTAIGDTVNVAARIESENKPKGTEVLIGEETWLKLTGEELRQLGCGGTPLPASVKDIEGMPLYMVEVP